MQQTARARSHDSLPQTLHGLPSNVQVSTALLLAAVSMRFVLNQYLSTAGHTSLIEYYALFCQMFIASVSVGVAVIGYYVQLDFNAQMTALKWEPPSRPIIPAFSVVDQDERMWFSLIGIMLAYHIGFSLLAIGKWIDAKNLPVLDAPKVHRQPPCIGGHMKQEFLRHFRGEEDEAQRDEPAQSCHGRKPMSIMVSESSTEAH